MKENNWTYFQYQKEQGLPVFVRAELSGFDASLSPFLKQMGFSEMENQESLALESTLDTRFEGNLLTLKIAGPSVSRQINQVAEGDRYGSECITPKEGYKVYRFKSKALLVYSFGVSQWEMGCLSDFGDEAAFSDYRCIMNRYLSWALVAEGIVGFWGVPVEEGMVVLRRKESQSEAVFIDVRENRIFSIDGVTPLKSNFTILRLDSVLKDKNVPMNKEELISFLSVNSTFFDYQGLNVPIRQAIQSLAKVVSGIVHPRESFKPRTDLSL